jgi:hypothetical protein
LNIRFMPISLLSAARPAASFGPKIIFGQKTTSVRYLL